MERLIFPSLAKPEKTGYMWIKDGWDVSWRFDRHRDTLIDNACWFDTYGDGMVQHSHEAPLARSEALDYVASLASALVANHSEDALACVEHNWPHPKQQIGRDLIVFAQGLRYKEDKRRYYNKCDRKVSAAESKRHDKRWDEVPSWADGSIKSVLALVNAEFNKPLETYGLVLWIDEVFRDTVGSRGTYWDLACHTGMVADTDSSDLDQQDREVAYAGNLINAYHVVDGFISGYRTHKYAVRSWECLQNNYCRNKLGIGVEKDEEAVA